MLKALKHHRALPRASYFLYIMLVCQITLLTMAIYDRKALYKCSSLKYKKRLQKQYQLIEPVTSFECPSNCLMTEGGSETVHTVKVPSDAPYATRSELMCPNFKTVTEYNTNQVAYSIKIN